MSNNNPKKPAGSVPPPLPAKTLEPKGGPIASKPAEAAAEPSLKPAPLFRSIDWLTFAITTLCVFVGYMWTLAPDVTLQDSGELAVASLYAGVPHPPGYPVWTVYTWLFTQFLPFSNIAWRVGVSSAVSAALACGLIGLLVSRGSSMMLEGIPNLKGIERRMENAFCVVSGFVAGMLLGYNGFMWSQAIIVEVYCLSVLSLAGVLLSLMRWIYAPHQRRYLYLAMFWFGICFNNHQSLLVCALSIEVTVFVVQPKLARDLLFWNVIIWMAGLIGKGAGMISVLSDNTPLLTIYNLIGIASAIAWVILLFKTRISGLELARDFAMVASLAYLGVLVGHITSYFPNFYYNKDLVSLKTVPFVAFNLFGLGCVGAFIYLIVVTKKLGKEWISALYCGGAWAIGAACYLYMALASMSNPPLNWGYPRTVTGFFHALTRGQYERIHPTTNPGKFIEQIGMYFLGAIEEFNLVYLLIAIIPFFFYRFMQKRERAWMISLSAFYLCLSMFLLVLLNPASDRQSQDLNKVFFTASHVLIAMFVGYGITLAGALMALHFERFRSYARIGSIVAFVVALYGVAASYYDTANPLVHRTTIFGLLLALAAVALSWLTGPNKGRTFASGLIVIGFIMPAYSIMSHWEDNEQRGHLFGYWFGHDMFTPPFKGTDGKPIYPEMDRDTVLFGGTDPGRFNPTYMIFCESFIPSKNKPNDPNFDRRDVYLITQNALADGTYLNYIRAHYNRSTQIDPPFFQEFLRGPRELELSAQGLAYTNILARAVTPLDDYFLKLGDNIEKQRRAGTSFFKDQDFTDLGSLVNKLRKGEDRVSKFLYEGLSQKTRDLLGKAGTEAAWRSAEKSIRQALATDLNQLLERELTTKQAQPLYTPERFQGIKLQDTTVAFIKENPQSHTRVRLNRLLLEQAYPKEIARSIGGVYPDREIKTPTPEESQQCFQEYLADAQRRLEHDRTRPQERPQIKPGEDVRVVENRVQVSGQVAVMAINGLLTKVIFDKNPGHEFYVEESFPLDWMYPHLSPFGIIMKINRQPLPEITQEMVNKDHEFWSQFSQRLTGNWITYDTPVGEICDIAEKVYLRRDYRGFKGDPKFIRDNDGQKAFSKLRSSIAGVYSWRVGNPKTPVEQQRMLKEAEFAFKQAYAFCPYSPEAVFRYINLLVGMGPTRIDDARRIASTSIKLDPNNGQLENLVTELDRIKQQQQQMNAQPPR